MLLFILYRRYSKTETACFSNCAEKLHLLGGEFPLLFSSVPWQQHVEIITKCNSMDEALFYESKIKNKDCCVQCNGMFNTIERIVFISQNLFALFQNLKLHQTGAELLIENSNDSLEESFYNFICIQYTILVSNN